MIETISMILWFFILSIWSLVIISSLLLYLFSNYTNIWFAIKTYIDYFDKLNKEDRIILAKLIKKLKTK
jgi:hypothetical protein